MVKSPIPKTVRYEVSIPTEHKAPDESTGTYTIVKNYRMKSL
jgi:hypothetical protein